MGNSSEPSFASLAVRKIILRIIIISSLCSIVIDVLFGMPHILLYHFVDLKLLVPPLGILIIPVSILVHHILRLWPRKIWSVRSDFVYSALELVFVTGYVIAQFILITQDAEGFQWLGILLSVIGAFAAAFLWLSLVTSLIFTIWNLGTSQFRAITSPYDFMENYDMKTDNERSQMERLSFLLGENIFRRRFGIDRAFIRGLRAAIAILCLLGMVTLGYLVLVFQPMQGDGYYQSMLTTATTTEGLGYTNGNVTMRVDLYTEALGEVDLDLNLTWRPESMHAICLINSVGGNCNVPSPFSRLSPDSLIIKLNYTNALQRYPIPSLRTGIYLRFFADFAQIDQTDDLLGLPVQLYPGFHLFGTTFYSFRDRYASLRDEALGIPRYNRYLVGHVQALIPDPEFANSVPDNTTATLRLTYRGGIRSVQDYYEVEREQGSKSVLSGLALLGGAWTAVNGVFASVFGCGLMLVLFGIKPLSIYGLVHLFQRRRSLADGGYTLSAEEQSRIIALLREHLLDDDNGQMGTGQVDEENEQEEERVDDGITFSAQGQSQANDIDVSREHLLGDRDGDIEAAEASEEKN